MMRFLPGAMAKRMLEMGVRTGQLRDKTGLTANAVKYALERDEAPDGVAKVLIGFLGEGLVKSGKAKPVEAGPDLTSMTTKQVLAAVERGVFTASAAWEREQTAEHPRVGLLRELQALAEAE